MSVSATKVFPSGAWEISAIVQGCLVRRVYYFMSKHEAIAEFKAAFRA
jgi:hypothetical protein